MSLTILQEQGLKIAVKRYKDHEPYTVISGYAGVGKSYLIKYIIAALGLPAENVAYISFTGKAASVLRRNGCPNAMTAHKLLYQAKPLPNGGFKFTPRRTLDPNYKLIVVDEISMLPKELWQLLLSHHIPILACGDPFQLPPVNENTDNHVLDSPDIFLDQIVRQAEESEIIRLSMRIRNYETIGTVFRGKEVIISNNCNNNIDTLKWPDQIITATNGRRKHINTIMRQHLGRTSIEPKEGDKIICLRNCWRICDDSQQNALVNGTIGHLTIMKKVIQTYPIFGCPTATIMYSDFNTEQDGTFSQVPIDYSALTTGKKALTPQQSYALYKETKGEMIEPIEFDYGYAITCHRAQGSEWDKVLVIEERFPFDKETHARWLYTACTRSSKQLILLR